MDLTALLLSRLQFGFTVSFHIIFPSFTIGLAAWLTVLEALMCGCPAISYGWGRGHVRRHNAAFRRFGLAEVAATPDELRAAVAGALRHGRRPADFSTLPSAAASVVALAERGRLDRAA